MNVRRTALLILAAAQLLLLAGCARQSGKPAPDFILQTLDGSRYYLNENRGRVTVLNFWATYCRPCMQEIPVLDSVAREYRDRGVRVAGICIDPENREYIRNLRDRMSITYPVLLDKDRKVARQYKVNDVPVTVFIGKTGRIRKRLTGFSAADRGMYRKITADLASEGGSGEK